MLPPTIRIAPTSEIVRPKPARTAVNTGGGGENGRDDPVGPSPRAEQHCQDRGAD
jgi:isoquinoline 1-oxidoreductase subunit beta